ncbi:hypothetical protein D3C85_1494600 [compost metagenome]
MGQMIGTVLAQLIPDRPGAQPIHQHVVAPFALEQRAVGGVVLQNPEAQLASGNDNHAQDQGEAESPPGQKVASPGQTYKGQGQHTPGRTHRPRAP